MVTRASHPGWTAWKLPRDCIITDADGAPYLRYYNHKMKRELVPIDDELRSMLIEQTNIAVLALWLGHASTKSTDI